MNVAREREEKFCCHCNLKMNLRIAILSERKQEGVREILLQISN